MILTQWDFVGDETEVSYLVQEGKEYQATFDGANGVEATAYKIFKVIVEADVYSDPLVWNFKSATFLRLNASLCNPVDAIYFSRYSPELVELVPVFEVLVY